MWPGCVWCRASRGYISNSGASDGLLMALVARTSAKRCSTLGEFPTVVMVCLFRTPTVSWRVMNAIFMASSTSIHGRI